MNPSTNQDIFLYVSWSVSYESNVLNIFTIEKTLKAEDKEATAEGVSSAQIARNSRHFKTFCIILEKF